MNDLAKQLVVNAGKVDHYQSKQHMADMTSHYFNGIMIGVSLCFFVSPDNSRGEWIVFLLAQWALRPASGYLAGGNVKSMPWLMRAPC